MLDAERLAWNQSSHTVGSFALKLSIVRGSSISDQARTVIQDQTTIAYLGEVVPHSSYASLGITNALDLLQVSPTDNAVELTQATPAVPGAPDVYYESLSAYGQTFARIVPTSALEAKAQVQEMQALGVTKLYVADDGSPYGAAIAYAMKHDLSGGISLASSQAEADGIFYGSASESGAARFFAAAAAANPSAKLFGPSALADPSFPTELSSAVRSLYISAPGFLKRDLTPAGTSFVANFTSTYGHAPVAQAIFGYEAMSAVLAVLKEAGSSANSRSTVVKDFQTPQAHAVGAWALLDERKRGHEHRSVRVQPPGPRQPGSVRRSPGVRLATASRGAKTWARAALVVLAAPVALLVLTGCGTKDAQPAQIRGNTLTIYVSVPLLGASRASGEAVVDAAQLALTQVRDHIGKYHIQLRALNDATAARGGWDPGQTTIGVRAAVLDPTTIGYVGELNSGASAVSIPPLNRAGIPQVSPTSSAVGLTTGEAGANPGEPMKYYPTGVRTFARVVPNDSVQAVAQVRAQQSLGCTRVYVLNDGEVDGADMASSYEVAALRAGLRVVGIQIFPRNATSYQALATGVAHVRPDCILIAADTESGAVRLTTQLAAAMPDVKIFGTQGLAESTFSIPPKVASRCRSILR